MADNQAVVGAAMLRRGSIRDPGAVGGYPGYLQWREERKRKVQR